MYSYKYTVTRISTYILFFLHATGKYDNKVVILSFAIEKFFLKENDIDDIK